MIQEKTILRIAVQKSGRLYEDSVQLLKECGIDLRNVKDRLKTVSENFPLEVFFLRDDDIPEYVEDGVADIGIVGQNVLVEKGRSVNTVEALGFGKCRLSVAVPKAMEYAGIQSLQGKRIATSYPNLVKKFLGETPFKQVSMKSVVQ
jgi:ATP phosphoribosyltransferase